MYAREEILLLLDRYGKALTVKQREYVAAYYCDDLSYREIAENAGITAAGVRDIILRAVSNLQYLEQNIGFVSFCDRISAALSLSDTDARQEITKILET